MIASLLLFNLLQTPVASPQGPSIKDFFPLVEGTKWQYQATEDGQITNFTYSVGKSKKVGDEQATPIITHVYGQDIDSTYYVVKDTTVMLVAFKSEKALGEPRPILQIGEDGTSKWNYRADEDGIPVTARCESALKGQRKILGKDVEVLELKVDAVLGSESVGMRFKQTNLYARGFGLVEMTEERKVNKKTYKKHLTLTQMDIPAPAGGK